LTIVKNIEHGMFPSRKPQPKGALSYGLDTKVLGYVREFTQAHLDASNEQRTQPLTVSALYALVQERDVQLQRLKKVQLKALIQRAQGILREEAVSDEDEPELDSDFEGMDLADLVQVKVRIQGRSGVDGRIRMQ
jgi:hypothetical protein